jgi:hypothetical protein
MLVLFQGTFTPLVAHTGRTQVVADKDLFLRSGMVCYRSTLLLGTHCLLAMHLT